MQSGLRLRAHARYALAESGPGRIWDHDTGLGITELSLFVFPCPVWLRKGLDVKKPPEPVKMTDDQKRLVRETWPRVKAHQHEAGAHIYLRIFQVCPAIKAVFRIQDVATENVPSYPKMMVRQYY